MIEEKAYNVTLTLRISIVQQFSPIERDSPLKPSDAIENAIGSIPQGVIAGLEGEGFEIAYPIDGEAEEIE